MPALIDANALRDRFDIDDADVFPDGRILPHIGSASRRLRQWVGADLYAKAALVDTDPNYDADLTSDLKNAEAHLAMHFAILGFNSPVSARGVYSTAMADEGRETRKYLSPKETSELATQYLETARSMADPWIAGSDAAGITVISSSDDCCLPDTACEAG